MNNKTNKPYIGYPYQQRLCEFLKQEKSKGITLEETAKALNLTRQTLTKYRDGENAPDVVILGRMADYFGVSTDYLLGRTETKTPNELVQASVTDLGISEISAQNIRTITRSGNNINILFESDEFKVIVEMLDKIKTISVGKRYYNERISAEFEEIHNTLFHKNLKLYSLFGSAIHCIEERHLRGDVTVNSDNPFDIKPEQGETGAGVAVNSDEIYNEKLWLTEYQLTEKIFKKLIQIIENDTTIDEHLFKNYDYKIGNQLDEQLDYHKGKDKIPNRMPPEDIKALEEFIKFYNEHYRKDGENNG